MTRNKKRILQTQELIQEALRQNLYALIKTIIEAETQVFLTTPSPQSK